MVDSISSPQTIPSRSCFASEHLEPGHVAHEPHQALAYLDELTQVGIDALGLATHSDEAVRWRADPEIDSLRCL